MRGILLVFLLAALSAQAQSSDELLGDEDVKDVYLQMDPADWQALSDNYLLDTKYKADFFWNVTAIKTVSIKSRGSGSRNPLKPALKIDFNQYVKGQTLDGLKSLVLDNNIEDFSMVHERTTMKAMRAMGVPAPREGSARLFVNGRFIGLYTIVEPLDDVFVQKQFGTKSGTLYEYNNVAPWYFQDLGSDPSLYVPGMFEPKTNEDSPGADVLVRFIEDVNAGPEAGFPQTLGKYLDQRQLITYVAVMQYLAEVDGLNGYSGTNNFYLYQSTDNRFTFIAWDDDLTFYDPTLPITYNFNQNTLTRRIWASPDLRRMYLDALRQVANFCGGSNGWLVSEVDFATRQVSPFAPDDPSNQCTDSDNHTVACEAGASQFDQESQAAQVFAQTRYDNVMTQLATLEQ